MTARDASIGLLAATFQPGRMRAFYETIDVGRHGAIKLYHPDGQLIFHAPMSAGPMSAGGQAIPGGPFGGADRGFLRAPLDPGGETYLTAWHRLRQPPLVIAVSIAKADALSFWYDSFAIMLGSVVLIATLLTLAGVWIMLSSRAHAQAVAERDRADTARGHEAEERRRIFETSLDLILVTDRKGNFVRVSPSSAEILGYQPDEMVGRSATGFVHPDDLEFYTQRNANGAARPAPAQFRNALPPQDRTAPSNSHGRACGPSRSIATSSSDAT